MPADTRSDRGFTLIELIVASGLIVLVLSVLGGIMISSLTTETSVRNVTTATSTGQLVTTSLERGIRNAATPITFSAPGGIDQMITARVAGSGAVVSYSCQAWYYSSVNQTIRYTRSATAITAANASAQTGWTLLASGVTPLASGTPVFSLSGSAVSFAFKVDAGKYPAVAFESSVTSQSGITGVAPC